eukprot:ANDGO_01115.mRNA.1 Guanine exchange factor for Rac 30
MYSQLDTMASHRKAVDSHLRDIVVDVLRHRVPVAIAQQRRDSEFGMFSPVQHVEWTPDSYGLSNASKEGEVSPPDRALHSQSPSSVGRQEQAYFGKSTSADTTSRIYSGRSASSVQQANDNMQSVGPASEYSSRHPRSARTPSPPSTIVRDTLVDAHKAEMERMASRLGDLESENKELRSALISISSELKLLRSARELQERAAVADVQVRQHDSTPQAPARASSPSQEIDRHQEPNRHSTAPRERMRSSTISSYRNSSSLSPFHLHQGYQNSRFAPPHDAALPSSSSSSCSASVESPSATSVDQSDDSRGSGASIGPPPPPPPPPPHPAATSPFVPEKSKTPAVENQTTFDSVLQDEVANSQQEGEQAPVPANPFLNFPTLPHVFDELISTEKNYVSILDAIKTQFLEPLRGTDILTQDQVSSIFGQIEILLRINKEFLDDLIKGRGDNSIVRAINARIPSLKLYTAYINGYMAQMDAISRLKKKNSRFFRFIAQAEKHPSCRNNTLESLLITPIQRIPRYELLIKELVKHSDESYVDYKDLLKAKDSIHQVAAYCNEKKREAEGRLRLVQLQTELKLKDLVQPHRGLIREASCTNSSSDSIQIVLMTDVLLHVDVSANKKLFLPLISCAASSTDSGFLQVSSAKHGIKIKLATQEETTEWLALLNETIAACIDRARKSLPSSSFAGASVAD